MSQVLILLRKSILTYRRARAAIFITFLVPVVLIYLFGHVFGLYGKEAGPQGITLAVVNDSHDPAAQQLIDALRHEKAFSILNETKGRDGSKRPLTERDVRAALHDNDYRYALLLPVDMVSENETGIRMKFLSNPRNEIEAQTVNGMLQKTVFSKVPQLLGQSLQRRARTYLGDARYTDFNRTMAQAISRSFGGDPEQIEHRIESGDFLTSLGQESHADAATAAASPAASSTTGTAEPTGGSDIFSRIVKVETEQVEGKDTKNPMAARIVGGYAIMFLLFAVSGSATTLFEERSTGIFQRLLSSPVRPAHVLWARFCFGVLLGMVQIATLFVAGRVFFQLDITSHLGALLAVTIAAAAACSSFGILVAAIAPSAAAAQGIATFIVISMSAVGGAWFPTTFMPPGIQTVSKLTIVYWSVEGLTDVLWAGRSFLEVLPKVGILACIAAAVMTFSLWRFSRNRFFEG